MCTDHGKYGWSAALLPRLTWQSVIASLVLILASIGGSNAAYGQAQLADDIVIISKGLRAQEQARTDAHLGSAPGGNETRFRVVPGSAQARLSEPRSNSSMAARNVLSAASAPPQPRIGGGNPAMVSPAIRVPEELPIFAQLEIPVEEAEGPADGLTLDAAIEILVHGFDDISIGMWISRVQFASEWRELRSHQ